MQSSSEQIQNALNVWYFSTTMSNNKTNSQALVFLTGGGANYKRLDHRGCTFRISIWHFWRQQDIANFAKIKNQDPWIWLGAKRECIDSYLRLDCQAFYTLLWFHVGSVRMLTYCWCKDVIPTVLQPHIIQVKESSM